MKIKKVFKIVGIGFLTCFSFYYTNRIVNVTNQIDPIMKEINEVSNELEISPINANIKEDTIVSGVCGISVKKDESYYKMKQLGAFNKNLFIFEDIIPEVSITDNYDKYFVGANKQNKVVALTFILNENKYLNEILAVLRDENIKVNFFIDGKFLENNKELIQNNLDVMHLENYGYDGIYNKSRINYTSRLINQIANYETKFCIAKEKNNDILDACLKEKHYTILPTNIVSNPYQETKEKLSNGIILNYEINKTTKDNLLHIITFIKQKGYTIETLENMIKEC